MLQENISKLLARRVEARGLPKLNGRWHLPSKDDVEISGDEIGFAEGQSFAIEYVDATGAFSRRRISVYSIMLGTQGIPSLFGICHERNAPRQFRVDRIKCCIDYDGEIHDDVALFLHETFGMSLSYVERAIDGASRAQWAALCNLIRNDAVLLAAMSRSDMEVHPLEAEQATQHLALMAERGGIFTTDDDLGLIRQFFKRLRPTETAIDRAIEAARKRSPVEVRRLLLAIAAIMDADGERHEHEITLLNALSKEIVGTTTTVF